ncbi:translation initiation factor eIF-2B subunit delta [Apiospora saccharicola]|uniref:Translation initiation factor eIF2B subunit delta n=1 Tax=Apiospora saccharicola TaxID=335842 RepID=A0ABR1TM19_9PEZI
MSTEQNGAPAEAAPKPTEAPKEALAETPKQTATNQNEKPSKDAKSGAESKADKAEPKSSDAAGDKKLTGAELKAKAKADKAARRAQQKTSKEVAKGEAAVSSSPGQLGPSAGEVKAKGGKGKDGALAAAAAGRPVLLKAPPSAVVTEQKIQIPECFSHLSMARRIPMTQADKDVHPSVLMLGQQMATFTIDESITRLKATMLAFRKVIESYITPPGNVLARHFTPHVLNIQIEYLTACRPMCFSMGNAIRWLKLQVSKIDMDASEEQAKKELCQTIDIFIAERITVADEYITEQGAKHIKDGDIVLAYGRNTLVEKAILYAHSTGTKFSVLIVDDPYEQLGQQLAKTLTDEGIKVTYSGDFGGLRNHMRHATKVFFAAEAMFSNGAMYARAGACDVAMTAYELGKKVITLCETINITERVATDSLTYNEIDPERSSAAAFRLMFDATPDKYISLLVTELGSVQARSAPDLLRKLEEFN